MNEAVDRLIVERQRLDAGLEGGIVVSIVVHLLLLGAAVVVPLLLPHAPALHIEEGFAVALPRGGGGMPQAPAPAPAAGPSAPPAAPAPVAPPKVLKPPKDTPETSGIPELDGRKGQGRKPTPTAVGTSSGGTGSGSVTPGLEFGPPGPGVPNGTDSGGDRYLAAVQQKIWTLWNQQIKAGFATPIGVLFTIQADGSVTDVRVVQPSGAPLLDLAAQRAIYSAAPFGPLPKDYGTNHKTVQALFKPVS